ncbi:hypothetical protein [Paraflavitalea speifideaquila]|uniref:hypothetical protein n=1 Tax=Paraflavitalea speifideaquila TaxID=3076558 RepID=UPI0028EC4935|nr:hypothetical protein [Paraflavitalea speifideiaquila]
MRWLFIFLTVGLFSCKTYMKLERVETNGETLPRLTTPARTCNTSDTTAMYQNAGNHKYFVYNFYNAGDCALMIKVLKSRNVGETSMYDWEKKLPGPYLPIPNTCMLSMRPRIMGPSVLLCSVQKGNPIAITAGIISAFVQGKR